MSLASVSAQQTASSAAAAGSTAHNPLASLSSNFSSFLGLLMTQLKNQDPTSPLDTNQFTSQLVQFSSVEQQINTNTSLTQLIQLTQANEVMQSSTMLGKQITVQSDHVPLQNGAGHVNFTAPAAEPVSIAIYNSAGAKIRDVSLTSTQGANAWTWDGKDNSGNKLADGAYKIAVSGGASGSAAAALPFTVTGTATGVTNQNNSVQLDLGALTVAFSAVQSVGN
jgi:flagellar basal-body rod modification protein FlgD